MQEYYKNSTTASIENKLEVRQDPDMGTQQYTYTRAKPQSRIVGVGVCVCVCK